MKEKISITVEDNLIRGVDSIIDNLIIRNRSQAIETLIRTALGENKTAVILAGGPEEHLRMSDREYRVTAKIKNLTVAEMAIKKLRNSGFKNIFVIAKQNILTKMFSILKDGAEYGVKISYVEEKESKGTANSLKLLKGKVKDTFLVVYGDIIFNKIKISELWNTQQRTNALATLMLTTSSKPSQKGNVVMEGNKILQFLQKPKMSKNYLVFSPIFVAEPQILEYFGNSLEEDVFPSMAKKELLNGYVSSEKERHIHSKKDLKW